MNDRNIGGRPFDADELGDGEAAELRAALDAGRTLSRSIDDVPVRVPHDFTGRVMAAIANEPAPGAVGFIGPLRARGVLGGFAASVRQAWSTITAPGLPSIARATALAYVLVVALAGVALAGVTTISVGSALGVFGPRPSTTVTPTDVPPPAPTLVPPSTPTATDELETDELETDELETDEPSESDDASDDHGGAAETDEPGDDHGGDSGPGSSNSGPGGGGGDGGHDGGSGSGSSDSTKTPRPSDSPRPTQTPKPSETPH